ncbi:MAG: hypothetical protein D6724_00430 [Armatimonadetes bacterium]|nr:MAG: hypothetical protein D6724_00430 [Armatimonadota bacterium]
MLYVALTVLLALGLAWYLWDYIKKQQHRTALPPPPKTVIEFWVYAEDPKLPSQEAIVEAIRGTPEIAKRFGPEEGLVFSDIRFSLGTVPREKNPYLFQQDTVLEKDAVLPDDFANRAERAAAIHTIRFVAEEPKYDDREAAALRLCAFCAVAIAALARGTLVVDIEAQSAWTPEEFERLVRQDPMGLDWNTAVREVTEEGDVVYLTRGLAKRGMYDLVTPQIAPDQRTVTKSLLEQVVEAAWQNPETQGPRVRTVKLEKIYDMNFMCLWYVGEPSRERHRSPWINCRFLRLGADDELDMDAEA